MFAALYPVFLIAALAQATQAPVQTAVPEIGRTRAKTFASGSKIIPLTKLAIEMNDQLKTSRVQLDELRELATKTPDDAFRKEINAYVDALDKAQGDQAKIARAVLVGITIANGRTSTGGRRRPAIREQGQRRCGELERLRPARRSVFAVELEGPKISRRWGDVRADGAGNYGSGEPSCRTRAPTA